MKKIKNISLFSLAALVLSGCISTDISSPAAIDQEFDPNNFPGSDIERINAALKAAGTVGGTVRIRKRLPSLQNDNGNVVRTLEERSFWLIDSAMLVPGNVHLIIDNCTVKLSDNARDNIIRSANCFMNCGTVEPLKNIRITGIGNAVLEGADNPRATGDGAKPLGKPGFIPEGPVSYGSDAGKADEHPKGDWRNFGILLVKVDGFTLEGLTIRDSHCWAVTLEYCTNGQVRDMQFYSGNGKEVNGKWELFRNQDGLDLRRGCRNILIENITGSTGDDLIALTALPAKPRPAGILTGGFMGGDANVSDGDVYNITIRNVRGYCTGGHHIVRFLNTGGIKIYNVILDGVIDSSNTIGHNRATVKIGDNNPAWGGVTPLGDTFGLHISNINSYSRRAILIAGSLQDSTISNVINFNPETAPVTYESGEQYVKNVQISNTLNGSL